MLLHYLTIAFRNFRKFKGSFVINLVGLTAGITCSLLIFLWINDELGMDTGHQAGDRIYQILRTGGAPGEDKFTFVSNSDLLAPALREQMSAVEFAVPVASNYSSGFISATDSTTGGVKTLRAKMIFAGEDFFNVFSFPLIAGDKDQVLRDKYSAVISDELAINLFGSLADAPGKSFSWDHDRYGDSYVVTGIFKKRKHSSMNFDYVLSNAMFLHNRPAGNDNWDSNGVTMYVLLKEKADPKAFSTALDQFYQKQVADVFDKKKWSEQMIMQRFETRYLHNVYENGVNTGGRIDYVYLFGIVGLFVLSIACINFMNLATARASRRLKEIGIKKSFGVQRNILLVQHFSEAIVLSVLSAIMACLIVYILLPQFSLVTGKDFSVEYDGRLVLGMVAITLITGIVSGSYPAIYLTSFKPVDVLRGTVKNSIGELWARKGLVVFQFSISMILIIAVVVVYEQVEYVQSRNLGYKKEHVVAFDIEGAVGKNLETFMTQLKNVNGVVNATYMQGRFTSFNNTSRGHRWDGMKPGDELISFKHAHVGYNFVETMGLELKSGRSFSQQFSNESKKIILNETAVKKMGLTDPIGQIVSIREPDMEIIGVVKDFHIESLYEEIQPMALLLKDQWVSTVLVRVEAGKDQQTLGNIAGLFEKYNPGAVFESRFLEEEYQALYQSEEKVASLARDFATVAIVISCLGLLGLASFSAERRTKEIGVRKILGAGSWTIVRMLSADFSTMIFVAIFISLPAGYYLASNWLDSFAFHVKLSLWLFVAVGACTLFVGWLTVGLQTFKAASANPVDSLRRE